MRPTRRPARRCSSEEIRKYSTTDNAVVHRSDPVDRDGAFDGVATSVDGNAVALEPRPWIEYARSGDTLVDKHEHVVCVEDDPLMPNGKFLNGGGSQFARHS